MTTRREKIKRIRRGSRNSLKASNSSRHRASSNKTKTQQHPERKSYPRSRKGNRRHKRQLSGAMCALSSSKLEIN